MNIRLSRLKKTQRNNNEIRLGDEVDSLRRILKLLCLAQKDNVFKISLKTMRSKKDDSYFLRTINDDTQTIIEAVKIHKNNPQNETKQI